MAKKACSVFGCRNTNLSKPNLSFFKLPAESERRAVWLHLISREDLQDKRAHSYVVCEEHFDHRTIHRTSDSERKILKKFAVPSLNLPAIKAEGRGTQTESKELLNKFVQTSFYVLKLEKGSQTANYLAMSMPTVAKLKSELAACKKKLRHAMSNTQCKNTFRTLCDKFLTKELAEIVKSQTELKLHGKGNRYSSNYKQFCINLYSTSPQAYKLLEKALCLPKVATIAKLSLQVSTEVNVCYDEKLP